MKQIDLILPLLESILEIEARKVLMERRELPIILFRSVELPEVGLTAMLEEKAPTG